MFEFIDKIKDRYRQNRVEKLLGVQKSLSEIDGSIDVLERTEDYISVLSQLKLQRSKLLKSEQSLKNEDPLFKSMYDYMRFEATYKEVTKGYRQGQIGFDKCDEILKAINNDKKVKYSDNLVFNNEGKLLLLKRSELDKTFPGMYTIPGGHVDAGEDHRTAAIRELHEESGLTPNKDTQFTKVGEYEDDKVCIEYYQSMIENEYNVLCLQSEEAWQYEWVDPRELDKYEFPLNMKQNIQKILYPNKEVIVKLGKAFKSGKVTKEKFLKVIDYLNKSERNYEELLKKQKERRDPEGIESNRLPERIEEDNKERDEKKIRFYKKLNEFFTDEKGEFSPYNTLRKIQKFERFPKGVDMENHDITAIFDESCWIICGGDWQQGINIELGLNDKGEIDIKSVFDNDPNQTASDRKKRMKVVENINKEDLSEVLDTEKSLQSINELYLQNRISDELYETIIEKAWNKSPIGTITTRSNGQKWKKVSETGNKDQDWQLVGKPKAGSKTDEPVSKTKRSEQGTKGEQQDISEHAKESSETALNNAIKESQDPEVREAAHQELDRREKEEHVQEEEKKDLTDPKKVKEEFDKTNFVEKFRTLSDEQIKFYLDAPFDNVKKAARTIADERGLNVVSKEDYIKSFEDYNDKDDKSTGKVYEDDAEKTRVYLSDKLNIKNCLGLYKANDFVDIRSYITNKESYISKQKEIYKGDEEIKIKEIQQSIDNLSKFIGDNKIDKNLSLNRNVLTGGTFFTKLKEGDIYSDDSFSSTSLKEMKVFGDFNIKILAKKGSNVANVNNTGEYEYLIDKGSKFRVVEKHENGFGITVELL